MTNSKFKNENNQLTSTGVLKKADLFNALCVSLLNFYFNENMTWMPASTCTFAVHNTV